MSPREELCVLSARVLATYDKVFCANPPLLVDLTDIYRLVVLAHDIARQPVGSHLIERLRTAARQDWGTNVSAAEAHELLLALGIEIADAPEAVGHLKPVHLAESERKLRGELFDAHALVRDLFLAAKPEPGSVLHRRVERMLSKPVPL